MTEKLNYIEKIDSAPKSEGRLVVFHRSPTKVSFVVATYEVIAGRGLWFDGNNKVLSVLHWSPLLTYQLLSKSKEQRKAEASAA